MQFFFKGQGKGFELLGRKLQRTEMPVLQWFFLCHGDGHLGHYGMGGRLGSPRMKTLYGLNTHQTLDWVSV